MGLFELKSYQRSRNLFKPNGTSPYRLSRSRLESFLACPRCFYLDRRLGIEPPGIPPYTLNSAVDELLKKEFDSFRRQDKAHPLMTQFGIDAVPFMHPQLNEWRENFRGIQYHHALTNLIICGAVDDLWMRPDGQIVVVDYKSTCTDQPITLQSPYRQAYKRQLEIYQWLLRKQGLDVSNTGFFVYCNADKSKIGFDSKLEFKIEILPYEGNDAWVETVVVQAHQCLMNDNRPDYSPGCLYCAYFQATKKIETPLASRVELQPELF